MTDIFRTILELFAIILLLYAVYKEQYLIELEKALKHILRGNIKRVKRKVGEYIDNKR